MRVNTCVSVVREASQQRGFANVRVSNEDNLEEVVVSPLARRRRDKTTFPVGPLAAPVRGCERQGCLNLCGHHPFPCNPPFPSEEVNEHAVDRSVVQARPHLAKYIIVQGPQSRIWHIVRFHSAQAWFASKLVGKNPLRFFLRQVHTGSK